tara:strand:- start:154 stop:567 length:414 start_codon:yes stop_codon:yes gene_type:complete
MKNFYAFLDIVIAEIVPQKLQTLLISEKLKSMKGNISFYSTEGHKSFKIQSQLKTKIDEKPNVKGFAFYSLLQFCYNNELNINLLKTMIKNYDCVFVRENLIMNKINFKDKKFELKSFSYTHQSLIDNLKINFKKIY